MTQITVFQGWGNESSIRVLPKANIKWKGQKGLLIIVDKKLSN